MEVLLICVAFIKIKIHPLSLEICKGCIFAESRKLYLKFDIKPLHPLNQHTRLLKIYFIRIDRARAEIRIKYTTIHKFCTHCSPVVQYS